MATSKSCCVTGCTNDHSVGCGRNLSRFAHGNRKMKKLDHVLLWGEQMPFRNLGSQTTPTASVLTILTPNHLLIRPNQTTVKSYVEEHCAEEHCAEGRCAEEHQPRFSLGEKNIFSLRFCRNKNIDFDS